MKFVGTWHIYEMDMWDEDYFNMEVPAYIEINNRLLGNFQFGLVSGYLDGEIAKCGNEERFEFTWEGQDENDIHPLTRDFVQSKCLDAQIGEREHPGQHQYQSSGPACFRDHRRGHLDQRILAGLQILDE